MTNYIVKAPVAKISVGPANGNRVATILRQGSPVPEGVDEVQLKALVARKLIEVAPSAEETEVVVPDGDPEDSPKWTLPALKKYAADHSVDLGDATKKADIVKVLVDAKAAATTPAA